MREEHRHALRVKPRAEQAIAGALRAAGVDGFLPTVWRRKKWSGRIKQVEEPLIPGYEICHVSLDAPIKIAATPGVVGFVGFSGGPAAIPDGEMEAVMRVLDADRRLRPMALLEVGQRVRVESGPQAGLDGIVATIKNERHLVVNLHLLERAAAVTLDGDAVRPYG